MNGQLFVHCYCCVHHTFIIYKDIKMKNNKKKNQFTFEPNKERSHKAVAVKGIFYFIF